ncbi:MAG TPA: hypothetical protein VM305_08290 [Candidatus Limnocylindrales bacterium]|nr:hypothetical protein [Candidatus Limnocylindrales bacterium]
MAEGRYVLVYHEDLIENFPQVWDSDRLLATWLRLFALADKLWPSPAEMPRGVNTAAVKQLVAVGLVEFLPRHRFKVRGLDAQRQRRKDAAKNAADTRWGNATGNAVSTTESNAPASLGAMPRADARPRPQSGNGIGNGNLSPGVEGSGEAGDHYGRLIGLVEELTGRHLSGRHPVETLGADLRDHGFDRVAATYHAVRAEHRDQPMDGPGLIYAAHKRLYPIPDAPRLSAAERKRAERAEIVARAKEKANASRV